MNMKKKKILYTTLITVILLAAGCSGNAGEAPKADESTLVDVLPNTEYILESTSTGKAPLQEGYYEETSAPDSATMITVQLSQQAFGDIDQDGFEDAAVTLVVESGGSGTFTYLALVLNEEGTAKPLPAVFLGDRIVINTIAIQSDTIMVTLLTRAPGEPMSEEPTIEATQIFIIQDDQLVKAD